jgi:hypothetical protein
VQHGCLDIRHVDQVKKLMASFLHEILTRYTAQQCSLQTYETILSALGKFEHAFNSYSRKYWPGQALLDTEVLRRDAVKHAVKLLPRTSSSYLSRAYPDPGGLIAVIDNETYRLQAQLQYQTGMRAEGVGAPSSPINNPITPDCLLVFINDPVTDQLVGQVVAREKGGKDTVHYVPLPIYEELQTYLDRYGQLSCKYKKYELAIVRAAKLTNQFSLGRGSHGLKHCFAQERFDTCLSHGLTEIAAMQQVSLEISHYRYRETMTYTRNR